MGSESTSSGGARDLDSARASPPLSDEVSEAATATADGEANIPLVGAQVVVGVAFEQGQRAYMEDRYSAVTELKPFGLTGCDGVRRSFLGVYDGHNGDWAAQFASERMHAFLAPDVLLRDSSPSCPEETHAVQRGYGNVFEENVHGLRRRNSQQHRGGGQARREHGGVRLASRRRALHSACWRL